MYMLSIVHPLVTANTVQQNVVYIHAALNVRPTVLSTENQQYFTSIAVKKTDIHIYIIKTELILSSSIITSENK